MRIALVWPWFRTLGHLYGRELERLDHRVLLVTTGSHFGGGFGCVEEIVGSTKRGRNFPGTVIRSRRALKRFLPDVVVEAVFTHPLWLGTRLSAVPRILAIHDPTPHDAEHAVGRWQTAVGHIQSRGIVAHLYFSESARKEAESLPAAPAVPRFVWPLLSEMPDEMALPPVAGRRGFAMIGRWSHYKGFDIGISAWKSLPAAVREAHPLVVWARGADVTPPVDDPHLSWRPEGFEWAEAAELLSRVGYVLLPYRHVSQSGVEVLAQQCGARVIYMDYPGLTEFATEGDVRVPNLEVPTWTEAMRGAASAPMHAGTPVTFRSRGYTQTLQNSVEALGSVLHAPRARVRDTHG